MSVRKKFGLAQQVAIIWTTISMILAMPWATALGQVVSMPVAWFIIYWVALIPGYLNALLVVSLFLDQQPRSDLLRPREPVTVLIAAHNEAVRMADTLRSIASQDYGGPIKVIVVDNSSSDVTGQAAKIIGKRLDIPLRIVFDPVPGKFHALNTGLPYVTTKLVVTCDADTMLHGSAIRHLVSRFRMAPDKVVAVAGTVLARNSRDNWLTRIQEWDYFLGIAAIKRLQGMYQGTLVAQGAFSLYKTAALRDVGGWPDAIGEDIVLTWKLLGNGGFVHHSPWAVAFTQVPNRLPHFIRQRSRWARGMIEGIRAIHPFAQPHGMVRFLTSVDLAIPAIDVVFTFAWLPGLVLAFTGRFWIVGLMTLLVLPLTFLSNWLLFDHQARVFRDLGLKVRRNGWGFIGYALFYQALNSPISVWGYIQEIVGRARSW